MKRNVGIFIGLIAGIFLTISFLSTGSIRNSMAGSSSTNQPFAITATAPLPDRQILTETASNAGGDDERPPVGPNMGIQAPSAFILPTPIPGETLVYFVPTDNDATATVLYLYNADSVDHIVALRGFNYDGAMVYAQNITIPASSFRRLLSDSVAAAPPPSWATPAPITTNFTDFVYFASLSLPKGVKAEGYVLFNPGTGTVDPRKDQGAIPLRFSTDPATVFLPSINR
jgi:hypothetical protein